MASPSTNPASAEAQRDTNAHAADDTAGRLRREALALFLTKGFAATSVREVATAAGVTIPALYYHYTNKDGLLSALVEELIIDGEAVINELEASDPVADPAHAFAAYFDVMSAHLDVFRLVVADPSVRSHEDAGHRLADQASRYLRLLVGEEATRADLIRGHAALGTIRRPLRVEQIDVVEDRAQILASAEAALEARP